MNITLNTKLQDIEEAKQIRKEENKETREWCYKMIEESDLDRPTIIKICIDKFGRRRMCHFFYKENYKNSRTTKIKKKGRKI